MDFRPKEILFGTNSDGTKFRIENWNYDAFAGVDLARGLVNLCWLIFLGFLISPYFLLITLMVYCGRFNYLNILGAIIGTYMLYDAYNGWLFTTGMHIFFNEKWMNYIIYLNVISVVLHVFLILFGVSTHKLIVASIKSEEKRTEAFLILLVIIGSICVLITSSILTTSKGWMENKINANLHQIQHEQEVLDSIESARIYNGGDPYDRTDKGKGHSDAY